MKYTPINSELFIYNRNRFKARMQAKSLAIFTSNDILPTNGDGTMPFKQNSDLFHLCGIDQEETMLILCPDSSTKANQEILFVKETSDEIAVWEGEKLNKKQASEASGIQSVYWTSEFYHVLKTLLVNCDNVYLNSNEHLRNKNKVETQESRFAKWFVQNYPLHKLYRAAPIMHYIRSVKDPLEIDLMQTACNITEKAFRRVAKFMKPGLMEYEIEAEIIHEFIRNRANGFAYEPIVASGKNACVLHYTQNNMMCNDGELVLMDFGAEYANYDSDLTRCIPVSGKFSKRQKDVYNAVLKVKNEAQNLLRPGILLKDYHTEVGKIMESELLNLKLIDLTDIKNQNADWPAYKKYFMHGTSHYIGLDTHDVGSWSDPIEAGMVFTCEPGIYIPEEGLGIRLEDDLMVTKDKPFNLMQNIPIEIEEIETLMNG